MLAHGPGRRPAVGVACLRILSKGEIETEGVIALHARTGRHCVLRVECALSTPPQMDLLLLDALVDLGQLLEAGDTLIVTQPHVIVAESGAPFITLGPESLLVRYQCADAPPVDLSMLRDVTNTLCDGSTAKGGTAKGGTAKGGECRVVGSQCSVGGVARGGVLTGTVMRYSAAKLDARGGSTVALVLRVPHVRGAQEIHVQLAFVSTQPPFLATLTAGHAIILTGAAHVPMCAPTHVPTCAPMPCPHAPTPGVSQQREYCWSEAVGASLLNLSLCACLLGSPALQTRLRVHDLVQCARAGCVGVPVYAEATLAAAPRTRAVRVHSRCGTRATAVTFDMSDMASQDAHPASQDLHPASQDLHAPVHTPAEGAVAEGAAASVESVGCKRGRVDSSPPPPVEPDDLEVRHDYPPLLLGLGKCALRQVYYDIQV